MLFLVIVAALVGIGFCVYCIGSMFVISATSKNKIMKIIMFVCGIIYTVMMIKEGINIVT